MTYEELQRANEATKPTDIGKGKDYIEVNQRIKAFRMIYPNGSIITNLVSNDGGVCIFRAEVFDDQKNILGTGTAYEKEGSTFINKTSYIENCETSAVGRALAMLGIGIDASIASKEEVENAKLNQNKPSKEEKKPAQKQAEAVEEAEVRSKVLAYFNRHQFNKEALDKICTRYHIESVSMLTKDHCEHYIKLLESHGGNINE